MHSFFLSIACSNTDVLFFWIRPLHEQLALQWNQVCSCWVSWVIPLVCHLSRNNISTYIFLQLDQLTKLRFLLGCQRVLDVQKCFWFLWPLHKPCTEERWPETVVIFVLCMIEVHHQPLLQKSGLFIRCPSCRCHLSVKGWKFVPTIETTQRKNIKRTTQYCKDWLDWANCDPDCICIGDNLESLMDGPTCRRPK